MHSGATPTDDFSHELHRPKEWASGVIVCSPHSGRDYPDWFLKETCIDINALRSSEDAFMDRLIQPALAAGAVTLTARLPRKRRRPRRGKLVDAAAQAAGNGNHHAQPGAPARERQAAPAPKPEQGRGDSFLTRLGRKLRALVTGG